MAGLPTSEMKPGGGYVMCLHDQIKHLEAENAELRAALWKIANPIAAMQRDVPEGHDFNGHMAIAIADKPYYYTDIARAALDAAKEAQS